MNCGWMYCQGVTGWDITERKGPIFPFSNICAAHLLHKLIGNLKIGSKETWQSGGQLGEASCRLGDVTTVVLV